jgi:hypothetical protein
VFHLGRAFGHVAPFTERFVRIDRDFKVRVLRNKQAGQVSIVDPQPDDVRSIPAKKLRLIDCAKITRRLRRAQLLRNRRFAVSKSSRLCAAGQGDGREENQQQDGLHMSGFHVMIPDASATWLRDSRQGGGRNQSRSAFQSRGIGSTQGGQTRPSRASFSMAGFRR